MSNMNWYETENWYAPLKTEADGPEQPAEKAAPVRKKQMEKADPDPGRSGVIALLLIVVPCCCFRRWAAARICRDPGADIREESGRREPFRPRGADPKACQRIRIVLFQAITTMIDTDQAEVNIQQERAAGIGLHAEAAAGKRRGAEPAGAL